MYNRAVILYNLKQFSSSWAVLEELQSVRSDLGTFLHIHTLFLMLQISLLEMKQCVKAKVILQELDSIINPEQPSRGGDSSDTKASSLQESMSQESNLQSTSTNGSHKLGLSHVIKDRKDFLSYYKRLYRILAKESTLTGVDGVNDNHNTDSDTFISLTAREMYEKKAFHDAVKALLSGHASGHLADHIALNNLGCLNFRQGKYTLACLYFSKTLVEMDKSLFNRENRQQEDPWSRDLFAFARHKKSEVMYNIAIQHMLLEQYEIAFPYFCEALESNPNNPRLWLRIAECCVGSYYSKTSIPQFFDPHSRPSMCTVLGSGNLRHIKLHSLQDKHLSTSDRAADSTSGASILPYAAECAANALSLLKRQRNKYITKERDELFRFGDSDFLQTAAQASSVDPAQLSRTESQYVSIYSYSITLLAYIHMELEDPMSTLSWAKEALRNPFMKHFQRRLIHTYAAEACCVLSRPQDAEIHLTAAIQICSAEQNKQDALSVLVNLAVVQLLRGNVDAAQQFTVQVLKEQPSFVPALLVLCCCELKRGHPHRVLEFLRFKRQTQSPSKP
eukprot:TRINITY_DN7284_c0_g1_i1.p1 TRINITY_DN7284_c0_g1~~TRINITY_DN7284_c0_g1_i1.p1  ORF type:complete len:562 (-),score=92.60 TRINITY_DN7284_c0_g1_i1:69-1754(-)